MATLTVATISNDSEVTPNLTAAAAGGDEFANDGQTWVKIDNGDGSSHTATFVAQKACNHGTTHDLAVTIPAGASRLIGPFDKNRFNDTNGRVQITYDAVTSVTIEAYNLGDDGA